MKNYQRLLLLHLLFLSLSINGASSSSRRLLRITTVENRNRSNGRDELGCATWRLGAETMRTLGGRGRGTPERCVDEHVTGYYARRGGYYADANEALGFARTVRMGDDGMDAWIFDVDENLISNNIGRLRSDIRKDLPSSNQRINSAIVRNLSASLWLYKEVRRMGFQLILLSGRSEDERDTTVRELLNAGYHYWTRLIFREKYEMEKSAAEYKSAKRAALLRQGYRIHGSLGDQWSGLSGSPMATKSFN